MNNFRTIISPKANPWQIGHGDGIVMLGSCFTDNIGSKLMTDKFDVSVNPLGILFHVEAIKEIVKSAVEERLFQRKAFFRQSDLWHHWALNNHWSSPDLDSQLSKANEALVALKNNLVKAKSIFITLGTSWVYRHRESNILVANCHKVPAKAFEKICLSVNETREALQEIIAILKTINPAVKITFTVSPVRHWKDGAIDNSMSKAILRSVIDMVLEENVSYFPSYEIMMDDLRDYRFYKEDMLHPSQQAVDYIYDFFGNTYFGQETKRLLKSIRSIVSAEAHRPINPDSTDHIAFLAKMKKDKVQLFTSFPALESRW